MFQEYTTKLVFKRQLTKDIWHLNFQLIQPERLDYAAGQYMILNVGDRGMRNYSICSTNVVSDRFELLTQFIPGGLASEYLSNLVEGSEVLFRGPAGIFTLKDTGRDKVFMATGTGIAPIKSILETELNSKFEIRNSKLYLFWGLRKREDIYFLQDFEKLAQDHSNFRFRVCLSQEENFGGLDSRCFGHGRINNYLDVNASFDYYVCGAKPIVESLTQYLLDLSVPKEQITFEKFV